MNTVIDLQHNADTALRIVRESKLIAYDTETSGVNWKVNVPIGYVLTDDSTSVYVPVRHGGGGNLNCPDGGGGEINSPTPENWKVHSFERALTAAFADRERIGVGKTVGHNLGFDCHMSANAGVMLGRNLSCTQNNQTLINEYTKSFSLDNVAKLYGVTAKLSQAMYDHLGQMFGVPNTKSSMSEFWKTSGIDPVAYDYAAGDGVTTLEVYQEQLKQIEKQDLQLVHSVEDDLIWTIFRLERRGIPVDLEYVDRLVQFLENEVAEARAALPDGFNPRSSVQMRNLMEAHGHTDWPTTEKGNPSFTAKWLQTHDIGKSVVALREWTNLLSTFVLPLRDEHTFNGRVHSSLNQNKADDHGTISGRLSCSGPNLQAVPKHNKPLAAKFRRAFVAEEGMEFCEADYSQAEPRLFAHYSGDSNLMGGYLEQPPRDVHTIVADMLHVDRGTVGKRMNMGMFTGMQKRTFASHMGMPQPEADVLWDKWSHELFPGVSRFQTKAKNVMQSRGYVRTLLGRRGRMESRRFAYKAVSKIIQGGNADIVKYKLVEIDKELEKTEQAWLTMSIHDSILWMSPKNRWGDELNEWVMKTMSDVQSEPFNLRVPFEVELDSGPSWAHASFGKSAEEYFI